MSDGHVKIIIATLLFSINPLLFRLLELDALNILWVVNLIASFVLFLNILIQKRISIIFKNNRSALTLLFLGIFFTVNNILFISSVKTTTIANAVLTHYLAPIFVFILGIFLVNERLSRKPVIALILSATGLLIMLSPNEPSLANVHFLGLIFGTLSAIFFSMEILLKKRLTRSHPVDEIVIKYLIISVIILLPFISFEQIMSVDSIGLSILLISGIIGSAIGISLFTSGLRDVKAQHAGIISYIEPLGAIIWGLLIIMELPAIETIIGGALILLGTYIIIKH